MKKILVGLIAGILLGLIPVAYASILPPKTFNDVNDTDWFYGPIIGLGYAGLVDGYEDGSFRPNQNITRAEASKLMYGVYEKVNLQTEFYVLNQKYKALNAKVSTLTFPGTCYSDNQWYSEGEEDNNGCACEIDGRMICQVQV